MDWVGQGCPTNQVGWILVGFVVLVGSNGCLELCFIKTRVFVPVVSHIIAPNSVLCDIRRHVMQA